MTTTVEAATVPTAEELVARAREIAPLLRANAAQGEQDRRVVEESIMALRERGLFKVATPRRFGGYETSMRTMLDVSSAVAEADGGTAWVLTLTNVCAWIVGLYPEQAQQDIWGDDPDALISGVLAPTATCVRVDGGYRVTGTWFWNSGAWHASWATLGIPIVDADGNVVGQGTALIPADDYRIEETWFVAGMKSTGSNCLIVEDAFVPDHRVMSVPEAIDGHYPTEFSDSESLYGSAFVGVLALVLVGPQLGMGRAALEIVREKASSKPISYTFFDRQADSTAFQLDLAKAATKIDTAHLHAYRAANDIDRAAAAGSYPDMLTRARIRADVGKVAEEITGAIDILISAHGAGSFADANPLQRIWRDANVAARHAVVAPAVGYEVYGKLLAGSSESITPLI